MIDKRPSWWSIPCAKAILQLHFTGTAIIHGQYFTLFPQSSQVQPLDFGAAAPILNTTLLPVQDFRHFDNAPKSFVLRYL